MIPKKFDAATYQNKIEEVGFVYEQTEAWLL
jgi:hypothetical protein